MASPVDSISHQVFQNLKDVRMGAPAFRKLLNQSNEKNRSVGVLSEQFAECCNKTAQVQFSGVKEALEEFSNTLARVELARKGYYQRMRPLCEAALVPPEHGAVVVSSALIRRDEAIRKVSLLPPPENDPNSNQNSHIRLDAKQTNGTCMHETQNWLKTYHINLKKSLRDYAYAQIEFAARGLEQWSNYMEKLAVLDFSHDTDEVITLLEEGRMYQQGLAEQARANLATPIVNEK